MECWVNISLQPNDMIQDLQRENAFPYYGLFYILPVFQHSIIPSVCISFSLQ